MMIFDYIFYRVSKFYQRWDDDTNHIYGIAFVTIVQLCLIVLIALLVSFVSNSFNQTIFEQHEGKNYLKSPITLLALLVLGLNFIRYLKFKRFEYFIGKWEKEDEQKKRKWFPIVFSFLIIFLAIGLSIFRKYYM